MCENVILSFCSVDRQGIASLDVNARTVEWKIFGR